MARFFNALILSLLIATSTAMPVLAEARIYSTSPGHCEVWDMLMATWPARKGGTEKQKCTKRAEAETVKKMTCRIKKRIPNPETGGTICIYQRAGYQRDDINMSIESGESCAVSWACPPE